MRSLIFAKRVSKEILREPLSIVFGIGFPVVVLLLLTAIQKNVPVPMFALEELTPGIAVFGLSFLALFSAQLVAKDRASSVLDRLFTTPMRAGDFIIGYVLPLLPMAMAQGVICYAVALPLGLSLSIGHLWALLALLPVAVIYIGIGLLCGSVFAEKTATSLCGALLTNLSAWLSGTWFSLDLVGEGFRTFAELLPFSHAVDLGRAALASNMPDALQHLPWVCGYAIVFFAAAVFAFFRKMRV